jgi:hypothetical protein
MQLAKRKRKRDKILTWSERVVDPGDQKCIDGVLRESRWSMTLVVAAGDIDPLITRNERTPSLTSTFAFEVTCNCYKKTFGRVFYFSSSSVGFDRYHDQWLGFLIWRVERSTNLVPDYDYRSIHKARKLDGYVLSSSRFCSLFVTHGSKNSRAMLSSLTHDRGRVGYS